MIYSPHRRPEEALLFSDTIKFLPKLEREKKIKTKDSEGTREATTERLNLQVFISPVRGHPP